MKQFTYKSGEQPANTAPLVKPLNICPDFTRDNVADRGLGHTEPLCKASLFAGLPSIVIPNRAYLILGQLGAMVGSATLSMAISVVVAYRSKKEMVRPNAWRIVAPMQNALTFGNWPVMQFIRQAVSGNLSANILKVSVSSPLTAAPLPALLCPLDARPEEPDNVFRLRKAFALSRTVLTSIAFQSIWLSKKSGTAMLASHRNTGKGRHKMSCILT